MGARSYPVIMAAALGFSAFGDDLKIRVRVYDYAQLPAGALEHAEEVTGGILMAAGVEATWHRCTISSNDSDRDPECGDARTPADFIVRILPRKMAERVSKDPSVYGTSFGAADGAFASHISIFYQRIQDFSKRRRASCPLLLGHFVAHEIGHLLLGPDSHSETGIMCVPFDEAQVRRALWGTLQFTPTERIRTEVTKRTQASLVHEAR
jgi:hypothetical protein